MRSRLPTLVGAVALLLSASAGSVSPGSGQPVAGAAASRALRVELTIYGASSLQGVLARVMAVYEATVPGTGLTISTDSSAALETKVEQGAPAEVFLSADTSNPQKLVELGEGDAAIVYATDAKASTRVTTIAVLESANVPARHAGLVVRRSANAAAAAFLAWFAGPDGQAILGSFGFLPPS